MKRIPRDLVATLLLLLLFYIAIFVWPTRWAYGHLGNTPIRWDRITSKAQFLNFHGWQDELDRPWDVHGNDKPMKTPTPKEAK
jgi:hypothetical protein